MKITSKDTDEQIKLSIMYCLILTNAILGLAFAHYLVFLAAKLFTAIF